MDYNKLLGKIHSQPPKYRSTDRYGSVYERCHALTRRRGKRSPSTLMESGRWWRYVATPLRLLDRDLYLYCTHRDTRVIAVAPPSERREGDATMCESPPRRESRGRPTDATPMRQPIKSSCSGPGPRRAAQCSAKREPTRALETGSARLTRASHLRGRRIRAG